MTAGKTGCRWHLRRLMAGRDMYATTGLRPLLAGRGAVLSREQVYRLVTQAPERLSLATLAALCGILGCQPGDLAEPAAAARPEAGARDQAPLPRPRRASVLPGTDSWRWRWPPAARPVTACPAAAAGAARAAVVIRSRTWHWRRKARCPGR